jgi:selenocysteine lyase/cysteine desulfurase
MIELIPFESQPKIDAAALCTFIQENKIDIVVLEHVTNSTGAVNDVKELVHQIKMQ